MDRIPVSSDQSKQLFLVKKNKEKESPEQMIRSLQGVFCKGRYCSWVAVQDYLVSQEERKNHKPTHRN